MHAPSEAPATASLDSPFQLGSVTIDPKNGLAAGPAGVEKLDPKVMSVLIMLAQNAGQVVQRADLLDRIWPGVVVGDEVLTRCIYELRRQLGHTAGDDELKDAIETLPKRGYRLKVAVTRNLLAGIARPSRTRAHLIVAATLAVVGAAFVMVWKLAPQDETAPTSTANHSIAVLPFVDMSPSKDQTYLADGIAQELLNRLARVPDLTVIARTSSFAFKGQDVEIREIAKRLNVALVLEGSVRTSGNRLRITAQLVRAADSTHLWSNTYDQSLDDIFAVQDAIAKAVVSELKIKVLGAAPKAKEREPEAFGLFLKARHIGQQHTPSAYEQSIYLYRQALVRDPGYVEAWDGLASTYGNQALENVRLAREAFPLAYEAAHKALALDPQYAQGHARLGWIAVHYDRDLRGAARHLSRALELDPSNTEIIAMAAILLRRIGRLDQAIEFGEYAVAHDPLNADAYLDLGLAHKYSRHWDVAIMQYRSVVALSPSALGGRGVIGEILVLQGKAKAALAEVRYETDDAWRLHVESLAHHALAHSAESKAAMAEMIEKHGVKYASFIVEEAAFRGDNDRAFEWLAKAAQARDPSLGAIPLSPFCKNLHKDPRWLPFLRKHGMAPEQLAAIKFEFALPR